MANILTSTAALSVAIRDARKASRLTQAELASRAGVTQATVSNLERGIAAPGLDTILRVLGALGLELLVQQKPTRIPKMPWEDG
jgi:HTH-type transcriptional regulator/antitoxin HipB